MSIDIKNLLRENSDKLEKFLPTYFDLNDKDLNEIKEAEMYGLLGGGKRIRAFLVMQFSKMFGGKEESALPLASAIEMIHAFSLIQDDMPCMDNDDYRRGKPSCHKVYGEALALLASDALFSRAIYIVSNSDALSDKAKVEAIKILSDFSGDEGMIGGQTIDIKAEKEKIEYDLLLKLHSLKTGKLICASSMLGCISAGFFEGTKEYNIAIEYSKKIGLAFQIVDDILDYYENPNDKELNSFTAFFSVDEAKEMAKNITSEAKDIIAPFDKDGVMIALADFLLDRTV